MRIPGFEYLTKPVVIAIMFAIALVGFAVNALSGHEGPAKAKPSAAIRLR